MGAVPSTTPAVDLVVPVKALDAAKSRLRGAADRGLGDSAAHARLALALTHDTVTAVRAAARVRRLLVVCSDPVVAAELAAVGVEVVPDSPIAGLPGLNGACVLGAGLLRRRGPGAAAGALLADLPALRPAELDAAIEAAVAAFAGGATRAFVPDAASTGTTLLLAAPSSALDPCFGPDSADRHAASGARRLTGDWPGLRRDVDTADDLRGAAELGLGPHTRCVLAPSPRC
jgi:2-phospho-L-lactate/phosphoenolpyruvate guanylyltransferase